VGAHFAELDRQDASSTLSPIRSSNQAAAGMMI
jgi:hypothetical protein